MSTGLLIVFTGKGKGKTTAALGMAIRAAGHGMPVLVLQFIKGAWHYGELESIERLENITIKQLGTGFTWNKENLEEDRKLARQGWELAMDAIGGGEYRMIVLDELNYVLSYGLLPMDMVLDGLRRRPPHVHVVVTGRSAPPPLLELADLVTEMVDIKHPYRDKGIRAQEGIEF